MNEPPASASAPEPLNAGVVGCGGWGTALALLLERNGHRVSIWGVEPEYVDRMRRTRKNPRYLPEIEIPTTVELTGRMEDCLPDSDMVVMATPTVYLRRVCERAAAHLHPEQAVVNVAKGIEEESLLPGTEIIRQVCAAEHELRLAGLFGPSHAEEVARGLPTTVVATSTDAALASRVQRAFMGPKFRVYTNTDVTGVELGAALKNVIAVAAGICDGLGFGDNAKAALLTRGLAEITRLGTAMGARAETFAGLTGLGDLITTCVSPYGRNRSVGVRIAEGETLEQILETMDQVAEGVRTTRSACALAERHGVEMPISRAVYRVLFEGQDPLEAGMALMEREPRPEHEHGRE